VRQSVCENTTGALADKKHSRAAWLNHALYLSTSLCTALPLWLGAFLPAYKVFQLLRRKGQCKAVAACYHHTVAFHAGGVLAARRMRLIFLPWFLIGAKQRAAKLVNQYYGGAVPPRSCLWLRARQPVAC